MSWSPVGKGRPVPVSTLVHLMPKQEEMYLYGKKNREELQGEAK